jgi:hypothetical protein
MDFNSIFNAFEQPEDNQKIDEVNLLMDFSEHPLYWIGGFNKIISNHLFFKTYTVKIFKDVSPDSNLEMLELAGEYLMFEKAWNYIKNLNINNPFHIDCLKTKSDETLLNSLEKTLQFFEHIEEYEKCILLKELQNKVKDFTS